MTDHYNIQLAQQPCVVQYVEQWNSFLVGTYDLITDLDQAKKIIGFGQWLSMNYRKGNLVLFSQKEGEERFEIADTIECGNGGVFDFNVRGDNIFVAHSNNRVSQYKYVKPDRDNDDEKSKRLVFLSQKALSEDFSIILTSIDTCWLNIREKDVLFAAVSDAAGRLTILSNKDDVADDENQLMISNWRVRDKGFISPHPVWQTKIVQPDGYNTDVICLVCACEDKRWVSLIFNAQTDRLLPAKANRLSFLSGVTSLCIVQPKADPDVKYLDHKIELLIGSYDETIKKYPVSLRYLAYRESPGFTKPECPDQTKIEGGGIWRLVKKGDNLYIAAMYAGCWKTSYANLHTQPPVNITDGLARDIMTSKEGDKEAPPLDYGIDVCESQNLACVVDFNRRLCMFFKPQ